MLEKLLDISKMIYDLYKELSKLEKNNQCMTDKYKAIIEEIKLCIFLEKQYYKKIQNYGIIHINDMVKEINVDDCVESDSSDFEFALCTKEEEYIINRRIFNRLVNIIVANESGDYYLDFINDEIFDLDNGTFILKDKQVVVGDRGDKICDMTWSIHNRLQAEYLCEVQDKINNNKYRKQYLKYKYNFIYINDVIEEKLLERDYKIDNIELYYDFQDVLDILIYEELLSLNTFVEIDQLLDDIKFVDDSFIINAIKLYIENISPYLEPEVKKEIKYGLDSNYTTKKYIKLIK